LNKKTLSKKTKVILVIAALLVIGGCIVGYSVYSTNKNEKQEMQEYGCC
jgi:predicted negative regulator of RcsB-dependent stress response